MWKSENQPSGVLTLRPIGVDNSHRFADHQFGRSQFAVDSCRHRDRATLCKKTFGDNQSLLLQRLLPSRGQRLPSILFANNFNFLTVFFPPCYKPKMVH
jgi:hypothetical protein